MTRKLETGWSHWALYYLFRYRRHEHENVLRLVINIVIYLMSVYYKNLMCFNCWQLYFSSKFNVSQCDKSLSAGFLFIVTPIVGVCNCSMFCCTSLYVHSVLQLSWWGRESWLLCLICLPGVSWWLSGSSSRCHGVSAVCDCGISWSYSLTIFQSHWYMAQRAAMPLKPAQGHHLQE